MLCRDAYFCPSVLERRRPIEDEFLPLRVGVDAEVTEALELKAGERSGAADARLDLRVLDHFQRGRIEIREKVAALFGRLALEKPIVETDFAIDRMFSRDPVQRRFRLASIRRITTARRRIVSR